MAARYTEVEHQLAVLEAEFRLVEKLPSEISTRERQRLVEEWGPLLRALMAKAVDARERDTLRAALDGLNQPL